MLAQIEVITGTGDESAENPMTLSSGGTRGEAPGRAHGNSRRLETSLGHSAGQARAMVAVFTVPFEYFTRTLSLLAASSR